MILTHSVLQIASQLGDSVHSSDQKQRLKIIDDIDLALLGENDEPINVTTPNVSHCKRQKEAKIGKPVTKMRRAIKLQDCSLISRKSFKFPETPQPKRTSRWKIGSGFEGITVETPRPMIHGKAKWPKPRCAKFVKHRTSFSRVLELSTASSPSLRATKPWPPPEEGSSPVNLLLPAEGSGSVETNTMPHIVKEHSTSSNAVEFTSQFNPKPEHYRATLSCNQNDVRNAANPKRCVFPSESDLYMRVPAQEETLLVREPSKSERYGWLKRPRKVVSTNNADEDIQRQGPRMLQEKARHDDAEILFHAPNAKRYGEHHESPQLQSQVQYLHSEYVIPRASIGFPSFHKTGSDDLSNVADEQHDVILDDSGPDHADRPSHSHEELLHGSPSSSSPTSCPPLAHDPSSQSQVTISSRILTSKDSQNPRVTSTNTIPNTSTIHIKGIKP